jgi:hypothetical protein
MDGIPWGDHDSDGGDVLPWEEPGLRAAIPAGLQELMGPASNVLVVSRDMIEKIATVHPKDNHLLPKVRRTSRSMGVRGPVAETREPLRGLFDDR